MEEWVDVIGWEDYYSVSSIERVKSKDRWLNGCCGAVYLKKGRILRPSTDKDGYLQLSFYLDTVATTYKVHRLVAEAFHGLDKEDSKILVAHRNNNRKDNEKNNLEIALPVEIFSQRAIGRLPTNNRPVSCIDNSGEAIQFPSLTSAARHFNISRQVASYRVKQDKRSVDGFWWRYT